MTNPIKKVVDKIKMKDSMEEDILLSLESKINKNRKQRPMKKLAIVVCSLTLIITLASYRQKIIKESTFGGEMVANSPLFTLSVYAEASDGSYVEKPLTLNRSESLTLVTLSDTSPVWMFSLKSFEEPTGVYYFDIYDEETNEDIDFHLSPIELEGSNGRSSLIDDPNKIVIYPEKKMVKVVIDGYSKEDKLVESILLKIEIQGGNYNAELIHHDKKARENNKENISIKKGSGLFAKVGNFKISYKDELDYKEFSEKDLLGDEYTREFPYVKEWGEDRITYVDYGLNKSEFMAQSDLPFSADIYTANGDMVTSVKSAKEKDSYNIHIKFANKKYYIILVNEDVNLEGNGSYSMWK